MQLQHESVDAAFTYFQEASAPLVRAQAGSLGILGAGNRASGFGCAISFWETREDLERSNANPRVVEAMGGYAKWMAGPFLVESYGIVSGALPDAEPDTMRGTWLRTTSVVTPPERLDELAAVFEARLGNARAISSACNGTLLLSPLIGSRMLAIEFWSSHGPLKLWDAASQREDQRMFREGIVGQPPVRDTLEVFGSY